MGDFLVIDAVKNRNYDHLWANFFKTLEQTNDPLKANYLNLDPDDFACLPVVIKDDQIICFSGLQIIPERWGSGIGRCSSRMWYHPDHRIKSLNKFSSGDRFLNSKFCVPMQITTAKQLGLDCLFISKENYPDGFKQYLKLIKTNIGVDFVLEDSWYNVCGKLDPVPDSCRQMVALHYLTKSGAKVWQKNMQQFQLQ